MMDLKEYLCIHCYKNLGKYYLFELKRYRDETPRPICIECVKRLAEFVGTVRECINREDEECQQKQPIP